MAKKENTVDVTAGLSFNNSQAAAGGETPAVKEPAAAGEVKESPVTAKETAAEKPAEPVPVQTPPQEVTSKGLAESYADTVRFGEARVVRIQAVVSQNTAKKLDELVSTRKIKSKNDLINFLLEGYLETLK